jgi:hypothetical protein
MLPGAKFLYYAGGTADNADSSKIFAASLANPGERVKLLTTVSNALSVPGTHGVGHLAPWGHSDFAKDSMHQH